MWVGAQRVVLDFYGNDLVRTKIKSMKEFSALAKRRCGVVWVEVEDREDPERCVLGCSLVGSSRRAVESQLKEWLDDLDQHSPARLVAEESMLWLLGEDEQRLG